MYGCNQYRVGTRFHSPDHGIDEDHEMGQCHVHRLRCSDPAEIAVRFVQLICMLFGLTSQCFTGDTLVSTEYGLRAIEEIAAGDYVWSENTETGEKELKKVLSVSVSETDVLVHVITENGTEIRTTENHPFYVEGKGWCAAAELRAGDVLHTQDGDLEIVSEVEAEQLNETVTVYNLEIEDSHTYYVSADEVLVHNVCGDSNVQLSEEEIKNAMAGASLKTQQKSVSIPVIQEYLNRIMNGEKDVPPIKVDGDIMVDGNHRYIASILAGIKIDIINWSGGNPDRMGRCIF